MRKSQAPSILRRAKTKDGDLSPQNLPSGPPHSKDEEACSIDRHFHVLFGRISTRTRKTFEFDGTLKVSNNTLTLLDEDGVYQCSTPMLKRISLKDGSEIIIDTKELKIVREIDKEPLRGNSSPPHEDYVPDFKNPRTESPEHCPLIKTEVKQGSQRNRNEPGGFSFAQRKQIKTEPCSSEDSSDSLDDDDPYADEIMLILCVPTADQIALFNRSYLDIQRLPSVDYGRALVELKKICNNHPTAPWESTGKGRILHGIVERSLLGKERILIVGEEQLLKEMQRHYWGTNADCKLIRVVEDLKSLEPVGPTVLLMQNEHLDILDKVEVAMGRTFIFDTTIEYGRTPQAVLNCTVGPIYHLITAGSVEEKMMQITFGARKTKDYLLSVPLPDEYQFGSSSHEVLASEVINLNEWERYLGAAIPRKIQKKFYLSGGAEIIAAVFRQRISYSSFSK